MSLTFVAGRSLPLEATHAVQTAWGTTSVPTTIPKGLKEDVWYEFSSGGRYNPYTNTYEDTSGRRYSMAASSLQSQEQAELNIQRSSQMPSEPAKTPEEFYQKSEKLTKGEKLFYNIYAESRMTPQEKLELQRRMFQEKLKYARQQSFERVREREFLDKIELSIPQAIAYGLYDPFGLRTGIAVKATELRGKAREEQLQAGMEVRREFLKGMAKDVEIPFPPESAQAQIALTAGFTTAMFSPATTEIASAIYKGMMVKESVEFAKQPSYERLLSLGVGLGTYAAATGISKLALKISTPKMKEDIVRVEYEAGERGILGEEIYKESYYPSSAIEERIIMTSKPSEKLANALLIQEESQGIIKRIIVTEEGKTVLPPTSDITFEGYYGAGGRLSLGTGLREGYIRLSGEIPEKQFILPIEPEISRTGVKTTILGIEVETEKPFTMFAPQEAKTPLSKTFPELKAEPTASLVPPKVETKLKFAPLKVEAVKETAEIRVFDIETRQTMPLSSFMFISFKPTTEIKKDIIPSISIKSSLEQKPTGKQIMDVLKGQIELPRRMEMQRPQVRQEKILDNLSLNVQQQRPIQMQQQRQQLSLIEMQKQRNIPPPLVRFKFEPMGIVPTIKRFKPKEMLRPPTKVSLGREGRGKKGGGIIPLSDWLSVTEFERETFTKAKHPAVTMRNIEMFRLAGLKQTAGLRFPVSNILRRRKMAKRKRKSKKRRKR